MLLLTTNLRPWLSMFSIMTVLLLMACQSEVQRSRAVTDGLRAADFSVPPGADIAVPGPPQPVTGATATPPRPAAQIYPGGEPIGTPSVAPVARVGDGVQLNFDRASITEVVDVILGQILQRNYVIDPLVAGEVVLSTSAPLDEADLLAVLETVLQMNGATLVDRGGSYAVVLQGAALGLPQVTPLGGDAPPLVAGTGVTIVPLRHLSAVAAAQLVQPLLSLPELLRIDELRNVILIVGTGAERQAVLRTLEEIDVSWMAGRSVGIIPVATTTPEQLIPELEALFGPLGGVVTGSETVRFLPMSRLNAMLVIANRPEQVTEAQTWITRLDRGGGGNVQFFVYELQHTPAAAMAAMLNETFGDAVIPTAAPAIGAVSGDPLFEEMPSVPEVTVASGGDPLAGVKVVANEISNSLLVRASPAAYDLISQTIRRLDTQPLQVLIEATIAEVVLNDQLRYGVQYFFNTSGVRGGFNTTVASPDGTISGNLLEPLARVPGFNLIFTPGNSNITIDALARVTDVQVLSSPSVVVQDNSEAVLTVGDEVPLVTRTTQSIDNPDAPIVANIEYRNTGVILQVKPRINTNNVVTLEIAQEVSRVQETDRSDENPVIAQRRITSRVNVSSGQTVALGGLIQDGTTRAVDKVPVLGDIPVLGHLFRSTNNVATRTELIVFITPRVIRNAVDARDISEELRSKMRSAQPLPSDDPSEPLTPAPPSPADPVPVPRPLTTSELIRPDPAATTARGGA